MALTLEKLLVQMHSQDLRCVAGFKGLQKEVIGFSILDTPEILRWLKGGEILVSAGYVMKNNPSIINSIVGDLHRKGCVGLGIKLRRYFDEVPEKIIEQGNLYDFPIFEIPYEIRFADLSKEIYMNIFRFNQTSIEKNNHVYQHLLKTVLSDATTEHMLYDVSRSITNPLILLNQEFELLACEMSANKEANLSAYIKLEYGKEIFDSETVGELIRQYEESRFVSYAIEKEAGGRSILFNIFPILFNGQNEGFLVIPETVNPLLTDQYELLDMIAPLIGIQLFKQKNKKGIFRNTKNDFLNNVLINSKASQEDIRYYCDIAGFNYYLQRVCICIQITDYINLPYARRKTIQDSVKSVLKNEAEKSSLYYYTLDHESSFFCFLYFDNQLKKEDIRYRITGFAENVKKKLWEYSIYSEMGISAITSGEYGISQAFKQSVEMVKLGVKVEGEKKIHDYEALQVYHILEKSMSQEQLMNLYKETVMVLDAYDEEYQDEMTLALEKYIENKFNVSKTAVEIHVHRNTLIHKLEKIEEILSMNLDSSEDIFKIELGMRARKLLHNKCANCDEDL